MGWLQILQGGNPRSGWEGWWYLYRVGWLATLRKCPRYLSRASGDHVSDRRRCIRTPIWTKLRPTRSARRARPSYLTAVTFQQHFSTPHKIIRLLNKRGFRSGGDGWSCAGCDGARVKSRCCKFVCRWGKGRSRIRYENTGEKYSPIIISVKQTLQTSQTISTTTQ